MAELQPTDYIISTTDPKVTGFQFVTAQDLVTGYDAITIVPSQTLPTASFMAWVASRFSRSDQSSITLAQEIASAGVDTDRKLAGVFRNYGHASVADMAQIMVYLEGIPDIYATLLYNVSSIGGGQQRSTRFQDFSSISPVPLEYYLRLPFINNTASLEGVSETTFHAIDAEFQNIQTMGINFYKKYIPILTSAFTHAYPVEPGIKDPEKTRAARVYDSARPFLPNGACLTTSAAWQTSAREWSRIVGVFKADQDPYLQRVGTQIEALLAPAKELAKSVDYLPEAAELLRYTGADETTSDNLVVFKGT